MGKSMPYSFRISPEEKKLIDPVKDFLYDHGVIERNTYYAYAKFAIGFTTKHFLEEIRKALLTEGEEPVAEG